MAKSIINADTEGLKQTGGDTNEIEIQTNGLPAITIDSGQNWVLTNPLGIASGGTGSNTGTFSGANVTNLNASNISSGVLAVAQGGTGSTTASFSGANITSLNASAIASGTVPTARLGSGTANSTTYLRGDQTWATVAGGVTSLNGETGAITNTGYGAIGSYFVGFDVVSVGANSTVSAGTTLAGSDLRHPDLVSNNTNYMQSSFFAIDGSGVFTRFGNGGTASLSGTWRRMGILRNTNSFSYSSSASGVPSLYVRIS